MMGPADHRNRNISHQHRTFEAPVLMKIPESITYRAGVSRGIYIYYKYVFTLCAYLRSIVVD